MSDLERTPAGLQMVIPGCERRTLPRSTTRVTKLVRDYFAFISRRACAKSSRTAPTHLCGRAKDKSHCRSVVCSAPRYIGNSQHDPCNGAKVRKSANRVLQMWRSCETGR
jgi:hypothetical protein